MSTHPDPLIAETAQVDHTAILEHPVRLYSRVIVPAACRIGQFSVIGSGSCLHAGTQIGRYCTIGCNVEIGALLPAPAEVSAGSVAHRIALHFPGHALTLPEPTHPQPKPTILGNDVWIGANAVIRYGVTIGDGAVIHPGVCVTRDVAPYETVSGAAGPSQPVRLAPSVVADLLALKWWDLDLSDLASVPFEDIEAALIRLRDIRGQIGSGPSVPSAAMPPVSPRAQPSDRKAGIASLQALINAVPAAPRRAPDAHQHAFADLLREKLVDADAPAPLIDAILQDAARIETRYSADNPVHISVLNSRLQHLIDLVSQRSDAQAALDAGLRRTVIEVLRSDY